MAFLLLLACGFAGGLLGGMGMGGGTALIPLLTLIGVDQAAAQGVNLVSFLPMAALALTVHAKAGLVRGGGLFSLIVFRHIPCHSCAFSPAGRTFYAKIYEKMTNFREIFFQKGIDKPAIL